MLATNRYPALSRWRDKLEAVYGDSAELTRLFRSIPRSDRIQLYSAVNEALIDLIGGKVKRPKSKDLVFLLTVSQAHVLEVSELFHGEAALREAVKGHCEQGLTQLAQLIASAFEEGRHAAVPFHASVAARTLEEMRTRFRNLNLSVNINWAEDAPQASTPMPTVPEVLEPVPLQPGPVGADQTEKIPEAQPTPLSTYWPSMPTAVSADSPAAKPVVRLVRRPHVTGAVHAKRRSAELHDEVNVWFEAEKREESEEER